MPFYYIYDCIVICRVWYELFENQIRYYTLFRVLRWEFASVYMRVQQNFRTHVILAYILIYVSFMNKYNHNSTYLHYTMLKM